jgi:hypothetical protein
LARLLTASGTTSVAAPAVTLRARARVAARGAALSRPGTWALLLLAGWLVQAGLRAWFGRMQTVPLSNPDETAYLIAARVLAGGPGADLSASTLYQGGYPLLLTPVYWFTSDPHTVYHAVLLINSAIGALLMPLCYLACRRLGLGRMSGYGVATVTALLPAGFFYSQYAMADAILPVITLAWLLTVHSWLTATSPRARYAAATGSALLSGYAYAVHSRGLVMLAGYAAVAAFIAWRRPAARLSVVGAALTAIVTVAAGWALNHRLSVLIYPEGARSLSGQMGSRLTSFYGVVHVLEMAAGQLWRLTLDSWGVAGIGLIAAAAVAVRPPREPGGRGMRTDLRVMAGLSVAVTVLIACAAPAALPADQPLLWASGRYLDGMIVFYFAVGMAVLLRESSRRILCYAACATGLFVLTAITLAVYAGTSLPTAQFNRAFNFAEPAVLTQDWNQASVPEATAVTLGLLLLWVGVACAMRRRRPAVTAGVLGACLAAVSLAAVAQMTSQVSRAAIPQAEQAVDVGTLGLKPGEQIAVASSLSWYVWVPEVFGVSWTELQFFSPAQDAPPAGVSVVQVPWPAGQSAQASWPNAPAGWRVVASDSSAGWVAWRLTGRA